MSDLVKNLKTGFLVMRLIDLFFFSVPENEWTVYVKQCDIEGQDGWINVA